MLNSLKKSVKRIEQQTKVSNFIPVLFIDSEEDLEISRHLIGPETVVIVDDIGAVDEC